jgi:VanZ family protein
MRYLAVLFAVFLILIIFLADMGFLVSTRHFIDRVPYLDKALHFLLIGGLTYLAAFGLIETFPNRDPNRVIFLVVVAIGIIFTLEEISQKPIRGRDASWADMGANFAGILAFGFLAWRRVRRGKTN